jgi:hypothetical protein
MEMDTASGAIIADTATVERKEGKERELHGSSNGQGKEGQEGNCDDGDK